MADHVSFPSHDPARRTRWLDSLAVVALGAVLLLPGNHLLPLMDRDEPRFSQATVEMIAHHEWIVPTFNGDYRFDKPVLTYWLMRGGYALFGIGEFGARFHSAVAAILIALALYAAGARWRSRRTGLIAGALFLSCLQVLIHGRSAVADMPMILFVTLSNLALFGLLQGDGAAPRAARRWWWTLYLSLALGFLAKGPIAWLVPGLTLVLWRFVYLRKPLPWRRLRFLPGLAVVLVLVGLWGLPALLSTQGAFWDEGMNRHVVKRGLEAFNGRIFLPFYYPLTAFISLFPWILFLGPVWTVLRTRWSPRFAFLAAWITAPYIVFLFYATQLPHYVMPAFPAFFLVLAEADLTGPFARPWMRRLFGCLAGLVMLLAVVVLVAAAALNLPPALTPLVRVLPAAAALFLALVAAALLVRKGRARWALLAAPVAAAAFWIAAGAMREMHPAAQLQAITERLPSDTRFAAHTFQEPSLVFYTDRRFTMTQSFEEVQALLDAPGPLCLVLLEEERRLDAWLKHRLSGLVGKDSPMKVRSYVENIEDLDLGDAHLLHLTGVNPGRSSLVQLRVVIRR